MEAIQAQQAAYADIAKQIWTLRRNGLPGREEQRPARSRRSEQAGFTVERGVADMPTAFVATYGSGKPVIAFIGEYDALPGLSQEAVPEREGGDRRRARATAAGTTCWARRRWRRPSP